MTTFSKFDRQNLKNLRAEMNELLAKYGMEANLEIQTGNMKFSDTEVEIKVKAKIKGAKTFSNTILETRVQALGIKTVNKNGDQLVDYNTRSYKYPFVYVSAKDGKKYKCDEITAKIRFAV